VARFTSDASAYIGIAQAIADYMDSVDSGDLDRLCSILSSATMVLPTGEVRDYDPGAIRAGYSAAHPFPGADGRRPTKHNLTNLRVREGERPGHWRADAYYIIVDGSTGEARILRTGRYALELEQRDEDWVFTRFQINHDY